MSSGNGDHPHDHPGQVKLVEISGSKEDFEQRLQAAYDEGYYFQAVIGALFVLMYKDLAREH